MKNDLKRGWGNPRAAKKYHYFKEGELLSLCRTWLYSGQRDDSDHDHKSNCVKCKRLREKLMEEE